MSLSKRAIIWLGALGLVYARAGRETEAREVLKELADRGPREYVSPLAACLVNVGLRDRDALCSSFDAYLKDGGPGFSLCLIAGPFLDEHTADPRIAEYMRRLHIIPS